MPIIIFFKYYYAQITYYRYYDTYSYQTSRVQTNTIDNIVNEYKPLSIYVVLA